MKPAVSSIAFVAYPSDDLPRTRAWYEEMLGLTFAGAYVEDGVESYDEAHIGEGCFSLMVSRWLRRAPGSAAGVAFEISDFDATVAWLRERGVTIVDVFDGPVCRQATLHDPEGNAIVLHERRPSGR